MVLGEIIVQNRTVKLFMFYDNLHRVNNQIDYLPCQFIQ